MVRLLIRAIIFDYYGVICPRIVPILAEETAKQFGTNYEEVKSRMGVLLDDLDDDKISFQDYWKQLKSRLKNRNAKLPEHCRIWRTIALGLHFWPNMRKLVLKLRKLGYKVPVLTNVTKTMVKYNRMKGRYKIFRPVFLSCYIGMRKPSPKIFKYVLKKLKMKPHECIFIDDQKRYLKGAKSVGIKTILFKNYRQLVRELKRYGVNGI